MKWLKATAACLVLVAATTGCHLMTKNSTSETAACSCPDGCKCGHCSGEGGDCSCGK